MGHSYDSQCHDIATFIFQPLSALRHELTINYALVDVGVERGEMIDVDVAAMTTQQLRQEETGERQLHQHALVQSLKP